MFNRALKKLLINLFKANDENNSGVVRLNQIISKLLTLRKFFNKLLGNWAAACKLLYYVLDMPIIIL